MGRSNFVSLVASRVSARDAAGKYGLRIDRGGNSRCIHGNSDSSPSMHFFPQETCFCFSCNRKVSAVDICAFTLGLSVLDAARQLDKDFNLHLWTEPGRPKPIPAAPRPLQPYEAKNKAMQLRREAIGRKRDLEAEREASASDYPPDEWLERMDAVLADIAYIDDFIANLDAGGMAG